MTQISSDILQDLLESEAAGQAVALATVVRAQAPSSAKPGARAIVTADGVTKGWVGGGCAQPAVVKTAQAVIRDGQPRVIRVSPQAEAEIVEDRQHFKSACLSGGMLEIFVERVTAPPRLWILGRSPVAHSLCALAAQVGFLVHVSAPDAKKEDFPYAASANEGFAAPKQTSAYAVIATQGQGDRRALEAALANVRPDAYLALIASPTKGAALKEQLIDSGHDKKRIEPIISPAGLNIGAATPEEIALSVLAEMVQFRRMNRADNETILSDTDARCCGEPK